VEKKYSMKTVEEGRYIFEAPMPFVTEKTSSEYEILVDGKRIESGKVERNPYQRMTPAGYIDTKIGTAHSRWMIAPGPWMPFSMVKMSPDNQNDGWQAGYEPTFESIGCFSHIHEWTMAGLGTMPTNGPLQTQVGDQKDPDSGYRSRIDKSSEVAPLGYYKVNLEDYDIQAELTATTRCGFQRYTFPQDRDSSRVLLDLVIPSEYRYNSIEAYIKKTGSSTIEGYSHQLSPNTWSGGVSQEYTVYFIAEFDQPISNFGVWTEQGVQQNVDSLQVRGALDAGAIVGFDTDENNVVQLRTAISYVSIDNARENLQAEISSPFGWDFEAVRQANINTWNNLLNRVIISSTNRMEKMRFYNNMFRSLCSRNTFSDVNGEWRDADEIIRKMKDPSSPALGCDAFWNTFWNLNQFWNLVAPEWSNRWVKSQLAMYDAGGWLAKGPAGMEYVPVMVAEHEIPLIVGAYQMGIRDYDVEKAYEAVRKMQTTPGTVVGGGFAGNRDLEAYLKYQYVPYDKGRFSNTLEYSFDDWTVSQFALALGKTSDYELFLRRGYYWENIIDANTGFARMKDSKGQWLPDFDAYQSGANRHYVEGNAWQLTYFVPQDVPALASAIGKDRFVERLDWGFTESYKTRFNGLNDQYWNYPVMQGNQQSMHFAFLFNWVDRPWLTQKWSRAILDRYYGYGIANAYLGDEDQGQMSAWFIMASIGLFQTDGGCRVDPIYEIGSPLYKKIEIDLGNRFGRGDKFIIEAKNASRLNKYIHSVKLNGKPLDDFKFPASELLKGGKLELEMGTEANQSWGIENSSKTPNSP
jgi:predicted alpha-1,2-mannosidase